MSDQPGLLYIRHEAAVPFSRAGPGGRISPAMVLYHNDAEARINRFLAPHREKLEWRRLNTGLVLKRADLEVSLAGNLANHPRRCLLPNRATRLGGPIRGIIFRHQYCVRLRGRLDVHVVKEAWLRARPAVRVHGEQNKGNPRNSNKPRVRPLLLCTGC